ncbi:hypothetical protein NOF04DRAFT_10380, partial [Fusarium oxysporum II5]
STNRFPPNALFSETETSWPSGEPGRSTTECDEKTLEFFLHDSVGDPVKAIIEELKQEKEVRRRFQIGDGVIFENHPHALSDVAEEAIEGEAQSTAQRTPGHRRDFKHLRPD